MSDRVESAVVLAAGEGTRMRSAHAQGAAPAVRAPDAPPRARRPRRLPLERIVVVVGHGAEDVTKTRPGAARRPTCRSSSSSRPCNAAPATPSAWRSPRSPTTSTAKTTSSSSSATSRCCAPRRWPCSPPSTASPTPPPPLLTARLDDPTGYGRMVRDAQGHVDRIVEQARRRPGGARDRRGQPVDLLLPPWAPRAGAPAPQPRERPGRVLPHRRHRRCCAQAGHVVIGIEADDATRSAVGVNDRAQLADRRGRAARAGSTTRWMRDGVTMVDPARTYVDAAVELAARRAAPARARSSPGTRSCGTRLGDRPRLRSSSTPSSAATPVVRQTVAREARSATGATVGPYVSLRPGTRLAAGAHVGTFVEIKNSEIGEGAKVPHLAYVGDADIGEGANIGAGNITANYDGRRKHRTKIGQARAHRVEHGARRAGRGRRRRLHRRRRRS